MWGGRLVVARCGGLNHHDDDDADNDYESDSHLISHLIPAFGYPSWDACGGQVGRELILPQDGSAFMFIIHQCRRSAAGVAPSRCELLNPASALCGACRRGYCCR